MSVPGKLVPPYGGMERCANSACEKTLSEDDGGAFLFKNRESGKLCVFCADCAMHVEINARERFGLVEL